MASVAQGHVYSDRDVQDAVKSGKWTEEQVLKGYQAKGWIHIEE